MVELSQEPEDEEEKWVKTYIRMKEEQYYAEKHRMR